MVRYTEIKGFDTLVQKHGFHFWGPNIDGICCITRNPDGSGRICTVSIDLIEVMDMQKFIQYLRNLERNK